MPATKRELNPAAQVAKLCKQFIKSKGIKCTARSSNYAGGDSVDISYTDVHPAIHKEISDHLAQYKAGSFDGMQDLYEYTNNRNDIPQTKYLFISSRYSDEMKQQAWTWFREKKPCANTKALPASYDEAMKRDFYDTDNTGWTQHEHTVEYIIYRLLDGESFNHKEDSAEFWDSLAAPAKPEPQLAAVNGCTISEHTHTKKGFQMWIVQLSDRIDRDQFDALRDQAKAANGWYSRKWGSTPAGFAFKDQQAAEQFAASIAQDQPQHEAEPQQTTTVAQQQADTKKAEKLRNLADKMQNTIDNKFADRLENTPKRMAQAAKSRAEGHKLQRAQIMLYKLADHAEAGTTPVLLQNVTTKAKALELATPATGEMQSCGFHYYTVDSGTPPEDATPEQLAAWALLDDSTNQREQDELKQLESEIRLSKPAGYFPTPASIVDEMLEHADIQEGMQVLEPSAGSGAILAKLPADAVSYEFNHSLCQLLKKKGFNTENGDFLQTETAPVFDRVVMNPPFEKRADIHHVNHAYSQLKEGGRLVAIMSASVSFRNDQLTEQFRSLIENNGEMHKLPEKAFNESGTNVNTVMVILDK